MPGWLTGREAGWRAHGQAARQAGGDWAVQSPLFTIERALGKVDSTMV